MSSANATGHPTHSCLYCNGVWVGGTELKTLLSIEKGAPGISELSEYYKQHPDISENRNCPACEEPSFHVVKVHDVELDFCTNCNGVFFDEGEIKKVLPNTHKSDSNHWLGGYVASEGLFWVLFGLFS